MADEADMDDAMERERQRANALFAEGRYAEAVEIYSDLLAISPTSHNLLCNRSFALLKLGHHVAAVDDAQRAVDAVPDAIKPRYRLASALYASGEHDAALQALEPALRAQPENQQLLSLRRKMAPDVWHSGTGVRIVSRRRPRTQQRDDDDGGAADASTAALASASAEPASSLSSSSSSSSAGQALVSPAAEAAVAGTPSLGLSAPRRPLLSLLLAPLSWLRPFATACVGWLGRTWRQVGRVARAQWATLTVHQLRKQEADPAPDEETKERVAGACGGDRPAPPPGPWDDLPLDLLEACLHHLPALCLVEARRVCSSWEGACRRLLPERDRLPAGTFTLAMSAVSAHPASIFEGDTTSVTSVGTLTLLRCPATATDHEEQACRRQEARRPCVDRAAPIGWCPPEPLGWCSAQGHVESDQEADARSSQHGTPLLGRWNAQRGMIELHQPLGRRRWMAFSLEEAEVSGVAKRWTFRGEQWRSDLREPPLVESAMAAPDLPGAQHTEPCTLTLELFYRDDVEPWSEWMGANHAPMYDRPRSLAERDS